MSSIPLPWIEIKSYADSIGPGRRRPERPSGCPRCSHSWIWYDGWRQVFCTTLSSGEPYRFAEGLWLQRVACARCWSSWTVVPPFLYPHRSYEPDLVESAGVAYLQNASGTYVETAKQFGCSWTALWRWIGWLAALVNPAQLIAEAARLDPSAPTAELIPRIVPQDHAKAYSSERETVLLRALQVLVAITLLARAQPVPPVDPSPLRWFVTVRFHEFRVRALMNRPGWSPALHMEERRSPG